MKTFAHVLREVAFRGEGTMEQITDLLHVLEGYVTAIGCHMKIPG